MRIMIAGLLAGWVGMAGQAVGQRVLPRPGPPGAEKGAAPGRRQTETVFDLDWVPVPGARTRVQFDRTKAGVSSRDFADYFAANLAGDQETIRKAEESGRLLTLTAGTPVLVVADRRRPDTADPGMDPVEVRVLGGIHSSRTVFVGRREITATVERPILPAFRPGARAAVLEPGSLMARDASAIDAHKMALSLGEREEADSMFREGRLIRIPAGVKVVILATAGDLARVKVYGASKLAGHSGFVPLWDLAAVDGR